MKLKNWILIGASTCVIAVITAWAATDSKTFRTTAALLGVTQGSDSITHLPQFDGVRLNGHALVNLAMGRPIGDTNVPSQVLAMTFECDLSSAHLVVYDKSVTNVIATIADSTSLDTVKQQDGLALAGPNRARFVAQFDVEDNGNDTDGLIDGFLTVAGRLHLDAATGCPEPVLLALDRDRDDKLFGDRDIRDRDDRDDIVTVRRTGQAHLIGVLDLVSGGETNTVLVPYGRLSIRRHLPIAAAP